MRLPTILTSSRARRAWAGLALLGLATAWAQPAAAPEPAASLPAPPPQAAPATPTPIAALPIDAAARDSVILDLREAFRRGDKARLASLLPQARGHGLEPWAAYWALKARLEDASAPEVADFLARWPAPTRKTACATTGCCCWASGATGRRFAPNTPRYRMRDDREVRCYAVSADIAAGLAPGGSAAADQVRRDWLAQREADDGCLPCRRPAAPGRPAAGGAVEEGAAGDGGQPPAPGARRRGAGGARRRRRGGQHCRQSGRAT
jgi:hypothetical protein